MPSAPLAGRARPSDSRRRRGEDPLDANAERLEPGDRAAQERGRALAALVRQHLGVGEPGRVVDGDVDELPAGHAALLSVDGHLVRLARLPVTR